MMDKEVIQIEKDQNMLFYTNSKSLFVQQFSLSLRHKTAVLSDKGKQCTSTIESINGPSKVIKANSDFAKSFIVLEE